MAIEIAQYPDADVSPTSARRSESDRIVLEGPQSLRELWMVLRTLRDFIAGFRVLHFVGPCVTVFGSARCSEDHPYAHIERHSIQRFGLRRPQPSRWLGERSVRADAVG